MKRCELDTLARPPTDNGILRAIDNGGDGIWFKFTWAAPKWQ